MKRISTLLFLFLVTLPAIACTTFFIRKNGQLVFGRNYDWVTDAGMLYTNLRGLSKTSMPVNNSKTVSWVSRYGSVTFNQYGKEFPTGGMNEKGLVVELMWLDETRYPAADQRPALGVLQWIQFQLDNCSSVDELIATDNTVRIAATGTPLHYLVADAAGNAATIEFLEGKMVVHKNEKLRPAVLTNSIYDQSTAVYTKAGDSKEDKSFPYGNNSLERFGEACHMVEQYEAGKINKPLDDYAFDILSNVAQGDFTKWSIVYDLVNKTIRFKTNRFVEIKSVSMNALAFDCKTVSKAWNMNQAGDGDVTKKMSDYTISANSLLVETAVKESQPRVQISADEQRTLASYPASIICK